VNKVNTRVSLRWSVATSAVLSEPQRARLRERLAGRITREGELVVHAGGERSRERNRLLARERLARLVAGALAVRRPRRPTDPTPGSRERRLAAKHRQAARKRSRRERPGDDG
jgi:ribosome-associated protein